MKLRRRIHRAVGISAGALLMVLAITGFMLNHIGFWEAQLGPKPTESVPFTAIRASMIESDRLWVGTNTGVFWSTDGGTSFTPASIRYPLQNVIAFHKDHGRIWIADRDTGIIYSDNTVVWKKLPLPESVYRLTSVRFQKNQIVIADRHTVFRAQGTPPKWTAVVTIPENRDIHQLILDIHTGRFGWSGFVYLNDYAALGLVGLVVTGVILFFVYKAPVPKKRRRRKKRQKSEPDQA